MIQFFRILYISGLVFIAVQIICLDARGQAPYYFNYSTGPYANLIGSTSLNNGQLWDDPEYRIPIGFTFEFFDQAYDSIYISDYVWFDQNIKYWISAYDSDFIDKGVTSSVSPISYLRSGTPGSQILKIEWNNVGFYNDITLNDFINVQLWLYESTNLIEIHIGPNSVLNIDSYGGPEGGVIGVVDFITPEEVYLTGQPAAAVVVEGYTEMNGTPVNGAIYSFTKCINPQAVYSYSVDSNSTAVFTTNIPNATYFFWDFGDSSTSQMPNPTHTYADTGKYPGIFVVSNNCDTDTTASLICIYPDAPIIVDTSAAPIVQFNTSTINALSYYWDFGDGNIDSGKTLTHKYTLPGNYTVTLIVDYGCGPDSLFQSISPVFVGVEENSDNLDGLFNIYPNPASDLITLKYDEPERELLIRIIDMNGKEIRMPFIEAPSGSGLWNLDISQLKPGMYCILVSNGETVMAQKLTKVRARN